MGNTQEPRLAGFHVAAPGEEGLVLLDRVQFVGGGVASFTRHLLSGVFACTGTRDVDVTAAEMAAALQGR